MKKILSVLLSFLVALSACSALGEAVYSASGLFSIVYPDGMTIDDQTYREDSTPDSIWLLMLYNDQSTVDVVMDNLGPGYEDFSLSGADSREREAYESDLLDTFSGLNIQLLGTLDSKDGTLFELYSYINFGALSYAAETVRNGWAIQFQCYPSADTDAGDTERTLLQKIVTGFSFL